MINKLKKGSENLMKLAVVGLGSMGKRRLRLIKEAFPEIDLIGIDGREDRQLEAHKLFDIPCFASLSQGLELGIEAVLVCTSPLSHELIIKEALEMNLHIFTEINLLNHYYDEVIALAKEKNRKLYLSSTFLHRKEIQYLRKKVTSDSKVAYRYHVGQYLPDWHPWESYKDFFVANKETNGCREIFAIELPWIVAVFGEIETAEVSYSKISDLEISYPDTYAIILKHKTGIIGTLNVDIVSRIPKRELEIVGEKTQLAWKGTPASLTEWSHEENVMKSIELYETYENQEGYAKNIIEDAYMEEIKEYIHFLKNDITETKYSFEKDNEIINWINVFEEGI